ncbi:hypothetical protein [Salinibacter ruber]|uniref:hypothetical protein n=1 Tax=Salinibacter ruber TaxID=146919 RepID=UPI00216709CF|nr:hypothetical protein [Salinibacter ruber]MCS4098003.1 hypothetical protein [Salinibacter ruber]
MAVLWPINVISPHLGYLTDALVLTILILSLYTGSLLKGATKNSTVSSLFVIIVGFITLSYLFVDGKKFADLAEVVRLAGYFVSCIAISGVKIQSSQSKYIIGAFIFSVTTVALVSVGLYTGLFGDSIFHFEVSRGRGFNAGLSAIYNTRSLFASRLCLVTPVVVFLLHKGLGNRVLIVLTSIIIYTASLLTLSRGLYVTMFLATVYTIYLSPSRVVILVMYTAVGCVVILSFLYFDTAIMDAFYSRVNELAPSVLASGHGAMLRLEALVVSFENALTNVVGQGFTRLSIPSRSDPVNPHNVLASITNAGGIVAGTSFIVLVWLVVRKYGLLKKSLMGEFCFLSFMSFIVYGLTHNNINTLFAWILLGIMLSLESS